jgi:hypothetical protein
MKDETTTYIFNDGTEPTVRRMPRGCDQQGRYPEAAEAATDVGQEPDFYNRQFMLEELGSLLAWALGIIAVVGLIAFLVGRFA